jgi:broad specificity phosphatase PhoE
LPIKKIYTSPVPRAVETGTIIGEHLGIEPMAVDALRELDCSILEDHLDDAAWQQWKELFDAWIIHRRYYQRIDGGENFYDVQYRFVPFIEGLVSEYADSPQQILCISHGGIYSIMLPLVLQNVDHALVVKYGFAYTCCIVAERLKDDFVCIEWDGHPITNTFSSE